MDPVIVAVVTYAVLCVVVMVCFECDSLIGVAFGIPIFLIVWFGPCPFEWALDFVSKTIRKRRVPLLVA